MMTEVMVENVADILAPECPELAPDCLNGTAGTERYRQVAAAFVRTYYPCCSLAFTYGSVAQGTPTAYSDVDLYILEHGVQDTKICDLFTGIPVEVRVYSPQTADQLLAEPTVTKKAVFFARALEDAMLVAGSGDLLESLRERAVLWLSTCPEELSAPAVKQHRIRVSTRIFDLADPGLCRYRRLKSVAEIADSVRALSNSEAHLFQGRNLLEHLEMVWPDRAQEISFAIDAALGSNDAAPLVRLALKALKPFGGLMFRYQEQVP